MTFYSLQKKLEDNTGKKLRVRITDNLSAMLSVRWEPDLVRVSMHRMFLQAPQNVMQALACYIRKRDMSLAPVIKAFIQDNVTKLDYSHLVDDSKLVCQGSYYNIRKIYDDINNEYFRNKLKLNITWFGKPYHKNRTKVTFGLYHDPLRLIKIHRLLDSPSFPNYLLSYVIYHEMLHHVCPSYVDDTGILRIHSKEFKEREVEFNHFDLAQNWIKDHQEYLFSEI